MISRLLTAERKGIWSIVTAATLWGTTGVCSQAIYRMGATNPLSVAFFRLAIGALILLLCCWWNMGRRMWQVKGRDRLLMILMGIMQAIFQFSYLAAIPYCGVTIATLVALCVAPVLVVGLAALFFHEHITRTILLALSCALTGTALLSGSPVSGESTSRVLIGVLLSLVCAAAYAGVIVGGRALSGYPSLQVNAASFGLGALLLGICALASRSLVASYPVPGWLLLAYMGCIPTALAYVLFQSGMRSTPAMLTSILTQVEPLTAAILAWIIFGERLTLTGILGALLLIATIFMLSKKQG